MAVAVAEGGGVGWIARFFGGGDIGGFGFEEVAEDPDGKEDREEGENHQGAGGELREGGDDGDGRGGGGAQGAHEK